MTMVRTFPNPTAWLLASTLAMAGCATDPTGDSASFAVGDRLAVAMEWLRQHDARPTTLAMAPPQRADGSYLDLHSFELENDTAITLVSDPQRDGRILEISVCETMGSPKADREWQRVHRFDQR